MGPFWPLLVQKVKGSEMVNHELSGDHYHHHQENKKLGKQASYCNVGHHTFVLTMKNGSLVEVNVNKIGPSIYYICKGNKRKRI